MGAICYPKLEGGLGLKDIHSWNRACVMQNIWAIIVNSGSLWIAWIREYVLNGRSLWNIVLTQSSSWCWKKLLKLRSLAHQFIEWKDGREQWKFLGSKY